MITTLYILYTAMLIILIAMIHDVAITIYNDWKQTNNTLADAISTHELPFGFRTNEDGDDDYYISSAHNK